MNTTAIKVGAKIAGATLTSLFVIGVQESFLQDMRKQKNRINKARENSEFYKPVVLKKQAKIDEATEKIKKPLMKTIMDSAKEAAVITTKEVVNTAQLGVVRSMESFVQEEQRELLRKQNGNIHRLINKNKKN